MRSDPLVLDRETKEPTEDSLPWTHQRHEPWKVIIVEVETNVRRSKKFFLYQEAKSAAAKLKEKYNETHKVGVVSRQRGYGPPWSKVTDQQLLEINETGLWWCPYCRNYREFHFVPYLGMRRCEFCHTRETDFHVSRCNPVLWSPDYFKRIFGEVYRSS